MDPDAAIRASAFAALREIEAKAFHDNPIHLPRRSVDHPAREFLEERMTRFEKAG